MTGQCRAGLDGLGSLRTADGKGVLRIEDALRRPVSTDLVVRHWPDIVPC